MGSSNISFVARAMIGLEVGRGRIGGHQREHETVQAGPDVYLHPKVPLGPVLLLCFISESRDLASFLVEGSAPMTVASTVVLDFSSSRFCSSSPANELEELHRVFCLLSATAQCTVSVSYRHLCRPSSGVILAASLSL